MPIPAVRASDRWVAITSPPRAHSQDTAPRLADSHRPATNTTPIRRTQDSHHPSLINRPTASTFDNNAQTDRLALQRPWQAHHAEVNRPCRCLLPTQHLAAHCHPNPVKPPHRCPCRPTIRHRLPHLFNLRTRRRPDRTTTRPICTPQAANTNLPVKPTAIHPTPPLNNRSIHNAVPRAISGVITNGFSASTNTHTMYFSRHAHTIASVPETVMCNFYGRQHAETATWGCGPPPLAYMCSVCFG